MIKFPDTLAFRLTLWYTSALVIFLISAALIVLFSVSSILDHRTDADLQEEITELRAIFSAVGLTGLTQEIEHERMSQDSDNEFLRLLNKKGKQIVSTDLSNWQSPEIENNILEYIASPNSEPVFKTVEFLDEDEARIIISQIESDLIIQTGKSLEENEEIMELLSTVFIVMFFVIIPPASIVGWWMAKQAVRGVEEVSSAAMDIENGNFDRRVSVKTYGEEIRKLADTFNAMAKRIQSLISEMREVTDNITHDLRSPLGRIRAISEFVLSGDTAKDEYKTAAADTLEECDRLINLINTNLDVAEVEAGISNIIKETINLSRLTTDACELFEPVAEEKKITLRCKIEPDCMMRGHKQNLQRMLANLLDNALKYTETDGKVTITLSYDTETANMIITDTGVGIPVSEQQRIFERFYRCDQSRSSEGCGMGLSFARAVAHAHDGKISVASVPEKGSTFTVSLPIQRSS